MRIHLSAAAALSLALVAHTAFAQPAAEGGPKFNIMGPSNCSGWPKSGSITSASKAVPLNWALGFVSGQAVKSNLGLLDAVEPEAMDKWLTDYCRDHPTDTLPAAVGALQRELEAKVAAASAPAKPPEPPMFYTPPVQTAAKAPAPAERATASKASKPAARKRATRPAKAAPRKPAATQTAKAGN